MLFLQIKNLKGLSQRQNCISIKKLEEKEFSPDKEISFIG